VRSFARHFRRETGTTPLRWLLEQRLSAARERLERTDLSVERIADVCGFGSAVNLRGHFRRELHTNPLAYRHAFGHAMRAAAE
jgi:transcriptional regulator GlxA family with amidase domain